MESSLETSVIHSINAIHISSIVAAESPVAHSDPKPTVRADFQEPLPAAQSPGKKKNTPKLKTE